jgi:hypothetical protein
MRKTAILTVALLTSAPALAAGSGVPPLPLAGEAAQVDVGISSLVAVGPAFRWASPGPRLTGGAGPDDRLAVGGFLGYAVDAFHFGGSVTGGEGIGRVELSTGYGFGSTTLQVRLGSEWGTTSFSPNPARLGLSFGEPPVPNGLDVGFTVRHDLTPNLYVSGTASAAQENDPAAPDESGSVLFGATIGLRF